MVVASTVVDAAVRGTLSTNTSVNKRESGGSTMQLLRTVLGASLLAAAGWTQAGPLVTGSHDANTLANAIAGPGITVSNATFTTTMPASGAPTDLAAGTFTGGAPTVGFDGGIVLTNGTVACAGGNNNSDSCGLNRLNPGVQGIQAGQTDTTTLAFDFVSTTGKVFFQYVFASEEYNEFVGTQFNDGFQLLLNGTNIAQLPGGAGQVLINNVNCGVNSGFYRNNDNSAAPAGCPDINIDLQYDGLTTVLTASGDVNAGTNHFEFTIFDLSDRILDSGVYIKAGSFSGTNPAPEPGTLLLSTLALLALARVRKGVKH
jgi:hypothetical protein